MVPRKYAVSFGAYIMTYATHLETQKNKAMEVVHKSGACLGFFKAKIVTLKTKIAPNAPTHHGTTG